MGHFFAWKVWRNTSMSYISVLCHLSSVLCFDTLFDILTQINGEW